MDETNRIRLEYSDRAERLSDSEIYAWYNQAHIFVIHQRQRAVITALKKFGYLNTSEMRVLEVGCGSGAVMIEFLSMGIAQENIYGVDLLENRLFDARRRLPVSNFANADGQCLPFAGNSFDLILQYTAISSVLDMQLRRRICADILRVLKPEGMFLSYDFWINPINKQTRGVRLTDLRSSFPNCQVYCKRITLAPPIARYLVPLSWTLSALLEKLKILNTHYLVAIRPNSRTV